MGRKGYFVLWFSALPYYNLEFQKNIPTLRRIFRELFAEYKLIA